MPDYRAIATQAAVRNGINPKIFLAQIQQESGFNPNARSGAGAVGIAQIVPHWHPGVDATDPVASLNYAAHLMGTLVKKYGDYQQALSVYNSGQPDAYKDPSFSGGQTFNYVKSIMGNAGGAPAPGPVAAPVSVPLRPVAPPAGLGGFAPAPAGGGLSGLLKQSLTAGDKMLDLAPISYPTMVAPRAPALPAPPGAGAPAVAPSLPGVSGIAKTALSQIGIPYQWGGAAKIGGRTDCSGLLQASAAANGVHIGRTTYEQWKQGAAVPLNKLLPGDAVFFHMGPRGPEHVAIYVGNGRVVEDPHTGASVEISNLAGRGAIGARRY